MANAGAKLSSFPEVNDIQTGDMFPLLSDGNTNAKIDYATLANAIIAKLKSENVVQTQTNNANKLISAALAYSMNQDILQLEEDTSTEQEEKSVTAGIVTVEDADGGDAGLTLNLEPHQSGSGDPSPENIRPISGYDAVNVTRVGKNLIRLNDTEQRTFAGIRYKIQDGAIVFSASTSTGNGDVYTKTANTVLLESGQAYTFSISGVTVTGNKRLFIGVGNGYPVYYNFSGQSVTFTPTSNLSMDGILLRLLSGATVPNGVATFQIEKSSTATDYEPYNGQTYTTALGRTVYGGTLDVVSGVLTVDRAMVTLDGTEQYWYTVDDYNKIYNIVFTDVTLKGVHQSTDIDTNMGFTPTAYSYSVLNNTNYGICVRANETGKWRIYVKTENTTLANLKTWLASNPLQVVYPLATPITCHLTPTEVTMLIGHNTIWMDADGKIKLDYKANAIATKGDVNEAIARIRALAKITEAIAPVESSYKATQNYSVGDYLIVDYKLYKVTAAIANGGTITPNTNVTATTIMTEIKALA